MTDLNEIKAKLVKLSRMTVENGCTEQEALNAASKISELLDSHGMTFEQVKAHSESNDPNKPKMTTEIFGGEKKKQHEVSFLVKAIADLFDCKVYLSGVKHGGKTINFFGFPEDVAACIALTNTMVFAMEFDYKVWFRSQDSDIHGKTLRKSFMAGFAVRVNQRLRELKTSRNTIKTTGTALVVLKNQLVESEFKVKLRKHQTSTTIKNEGAFEAGQRAGGNVSLGQKQIGV